MDNSTRSERSRQAVIQAALTIIARDGPRRLTLDAIAREGGISKGGLMHQFPTKSAVLKALLDYQMEHLETFTRDYLAAAEGAEVHLLSQIATSHEAAVRPESVAIAVLGLISEEPGLLARIRDIEVERIALIKAEAPDPELALLRWAAGRGLAITAMLGMCPLTETEREQLFDRLLDTPKWASVAKPRGRKASNDQPEQTKRR